MKGQRAALSTVILNFFSCFQSVTLEIPRSLAAADLLPLVSLSTLRSCCRRSVEEDRRFYDNQPEELQHFYGEITGMDRAFGKLRSALKQLDSYDNTILWYCSDNGGLPRIGSTGGRGNKGQIYEGGLKVPALIEWPAKIKESEFQPIRLISSRLCLT